MLPALRAILAAMDGSTTVPHSQAALRIVMIGPFGLSPKGTMRVRALPLARRLVARGYAVKILMPPWHTPQDAGRMWQEDGVQLEYVSLAPRIPVLSYLCITLRLVRRALAWRPDVVHCFKPKAYAGLAAWALWYLRYLGIVRIRLVVDEDDWEGPGGWNELEPYSLPLRAFFAWQERWGLRHNDALTVVSRTLESIAWSLGVPPQRTHYLPNGAAPVSPGDRERIRKRYGLGDAPVLLLYTRFFEYDVARSVDVLRQVLSIVPGTRMLVVGEGLFAQDDARFDRLVAEAGLGDCVVRAGWVAMEDLPDHFAASDVAIYPLDDTLVNRCKGVLKLVDLLAHGVAVVADAVGMATEYIDHRETGLLVPAGDVEAMAAAAVHLLQDVPLRRRLGHEAARSIQDHYGWDALATRALTAYGAGEDARGGVL